MSERPPLPHDPLDVKRQLQDRISDLLPRLGIKERDRGGMVMPLNPRRGDRHPGSFVIWTTGDGVGAWKDYAIDAKGDVFDLIAYLENLAAWIDAYWWALDFLGLQRGQVRTASQEAQDRQRREADRKAAEAKARHLDDVKAGKAFELWLKCAREIQGTPAWTYLTVARRLPLAGLKKQPGALRFHPALEHLDTETGELTEWPAMVNAMSRWNDGTVRAAHRTYLTADGLAKAPVAKAKKMLGVAAGCAIRVWKGASGLSPERAGREGVKSPLVITEGFEDALTAAIAMPAYRVWAAGSLSLLGTLGWPDCASAVVLVADNDWDKPQAQAAFERVLKHWQDLAKGRPLKVARAGVGKDLNDWARGG